jgi:hypothetical protein
MDFDKFIRIITEGGTRSEIDFIFDALVDYNKKNSDYDFWKEHIKFHKTKEIYDYVTSGCDDWGLSILQWTDNQGGKHYQKESRLPHQR